MRDYFGRKLHVSWLVAWFSSAFIVGIATAYWIYIPINVVLFAVVFALIVISILKRTFGTVLLIMAAGLTLGMCRGGFERSELKKYDNFYGKHVILSGVVSEDAAKGANGDLRVNLKSIKLDGMPMPGQVWISSYTKLTIKRSDTVTLNGKLKPGFGSYPASINYAVITGVNRQHGDIGLRLRDWFAYSVKRSIPEPQSSLAVGFLVGQHSNLPTDLNNQLKVVGLTHIVVASGYNLTILVIFARRLFLGLSKFLATFFASLMIFGFIAITGLSPSMTRAGLVSGLSLAAWYYGRKIHPLILLPFAAALTVAINPDYVWGDIGWYLSFVSFAGVLLLAPLVHQFLWRDKQPGAIKEIFIATICAQLATLPIIIFTFGHYSVYALAANLLVLPFIPLTMILTFIAGTLGLLLPQFSIWFGTPATFVLRYMTSVITHISSLPGAQGDLSIDAIAMTFAYTMISGTAYLLWRKTHYDFRNENYSE